MCAQHAPNNPWPSLTAALYRGDAVNTLSVSVRAAERENKRLPEAEHQQGERIRSHRRLASCSRPPQFPVQFPVSHNGGRRQPSPCRKYLLNTDNTTLYTSHHRDHIHFFLQYDTNMKYYMNAPPQTQSIMATASLCIVYKCSGERLLTHWRLKLGPFVFLFFF